MPVKKSKFQPCRPCPRSAPINTSLTEPTYLISRYEWATFPLSPRHLRKEGSKESAVLFSISIQTAAQKTYATISTNPSLCFGQKQLSINPNFHATEMESHRLIPTISRFFFFISSPSPPSSSSPLQPCLILHHLPPPSPFPIPDPSNPPPLCSPSSNGSNPLLCKLSAPPTSIRSSTLISR